MSSQKVTDALYTTGVVRLQEYKISKESKLKIMTFMVMYTECIWRHFRSHLFFHFPRTVVLKPLGTTSG